MKKEVFLVLALSVVSSMVAVAQSSSSSDPSTYSGGTSSSPNDASGGSSDSGSMGGDPTGGAGSTGGTSGPQVIVLERQFIILDTKQQGYLTPSEAANDNDLSNHFSQADTNQDGQITITEYIVYKETGMGGSGTGESSSSDMRSGSSGGTSSDSTTSGSSAGAGSPGGSSSSRGTTDEKFKRDTEGRGVGTPGAKSGSGPDRER